MRSLGLKSHIEWVDYCKSRKKPADIPSNPNKTYAETKVGLVLAIGSGLATSPISFVKVSIFQRSSHFRAQPPV